MHSVIIVPVLVHALSNTTQIHIYGYNPLHRNYENLNKVLQYNEFIVSIYLLISRLVHQIRLNITSIYLQQMCIKLCKTWYESIHSDNVEIDISQLWLR